MPSSRSFRTDQPDAARGHVTAAEPGSGGREQASKAAGFGLSVAIYVVISSMIGVGVLTTSGYTVAAVGSNQLMLGLWLFGGLVALCGALTIAELSASGGEYIYLYEAYGPSVAFLSGWVSFMIGFAAPIAAAAFASSSYLLAPFGLQPAVSRLTAQVIATLAILVFAVIHNLGQSRTARVHSVITLLKVGVLASFLIAGLAAGWRNSVNLADRPPLDLGVATAMLFSMVYISYAYTGWNAAAYLAGEIDDPGRRLPRAILIGTTAVIALYLGLNTVYALALPAAEVRAIAARDGFDAVAPIAELAARRLFGPSLAARLSIAIGLTLPRSSGESAPPTATSSSSAPPTAWSATRPCWSGMAGAGSGWTPTPRR